MNPADDSSFFNASRLPLRGFWMLVDTRYLLLTTYYLLLITYCLVPEDDFEVEYYLLLTTYYLLLATYYLLVHSPR